MKKKSVLSLLLAAALALSLAGCAGQGQPGGKEPVVNSDGTITKEENDVKITETAARSIETELYETADFSLQIPKGWTVTSGGTAMYHSIRVQDPSQPLNQMFVLLKAEGLLHSQEGKDAYASVSYTHLDVYKRQYLRRLRIAVGLKCNEIVRILFH